jgi:hypothetical protein
MREAIAVLTTIVGLGACEQGAPRREPAPAPSTVASVSVPDPIVEAVEEPPERTTRVQFKRGTSSAKLEGGVVRGSRESYGLTARQGQIMTVRLSSLEDNAVFTIRKPDGATVAGTEEGRDAKGWTGKLPASGSYAIVVGATRGNASFTLEVSITP